MRTYRTIAVTLAVSVCCMTPPAAFSAGEPLTAFMKVATRGGRSHGPVPVDVSFSCPGNAVLTGRLDMVFLDSGQVTGRYTTRERELTVGAGQPPKRLLLPPGIASIWAGQGEVVMTFTTKDGVRMPISPQVFSVAGSGGRDMVICACHDGYGSESTEAKLADALSLEKRDPARKPEVHVDPVRTSVVRARSVNLPATPLGYCCYDLVFLAGGGLSGLRPQQLDALRRWVEGGGSLCVMPGDDLREYHLEFLNALAGGPLPAFEFAPDGALRAASDATGEGTLLFRSELGRAAVVMQPPREPAGDAGWRRTAAFLWKLRGNQVEPLVKTGQWEMDREQEGGESFSEYGASTMDMSYTGEAPMTSRANAYGRMPLPAGSGLVEALRPADVRVVPFGLVALILFAYVLVIGPGDYFGLGLLRMRRYTWLSLPIVSVGVTIFVVLLSRVYMGAGEHRNTLVLHDVGSGGKVLRTSKFELLFYGRERTVTTTMEDGVFTTLDVSADPYMYDPSYGPSYGPRKPPLTFSGTVPGRYSVTQKVPQWTAVLNRHFTFEPPDNRPEIDWDAVRPEDLADTGRWGAVVDRLLGDRRDDGTAVLISGGGVAQWVSGMPDEHVAAFLQQCSARPRMGMFSVISQVSPTGAGNFEDLSVLDATASGGCLVMVVRRTGEDYVVYRRLYLGARS